MFKDKFLKKIINIFFLIIYTTQLFANDLLLDPNSKHNTKLDKAQNGVPIVNISTPNKHGISINEFLEYNIGKEGQVLNNADNIGRAHLAGLINSNPNLGPHQAANLIVLQVNGANKSQIEGYLEALSRKKVDVIFSNPNGIYFNNAGTINIKNFTVATGEIKLKDGDFIGIDVKRGNIAIGPKGLNLTNTDYVSILTRALELRGNLVLEKDLKIVTGSNKIDKKGNIEKINNDSDINIAVDASELGAMYAGQIKIISTDKGVGVNSDSFIVSKDKKLEITADGKIKVNKIQGKGIKIAAKEYEQNISALSDENIDIKAEKIKLCGNTQTKENIILDGNVENDSTVLAKSLKTKNLKNNNTLEIKDNTEINGDLLNLGNIKAGNIFSSNSINSGAILVNENFKTQNLKNSGTIISKNLTANNSLENSKMIESENLYVEGNDFLNSGNIKANDIQAKVNNIKNDGQILAHNNINFNNTNLKNTKKILAVKNILANNTDLTNSGEIISAGKIELNNSSLSNSNKILSNNIEIKDNKKFENVGSIKADNLILTSKNDLNLVGSLHAENKLEIVGANILNDGKTTSNNNISIKAGNFLNNKELISKNLNFNIDKDIENKSVLSAEKLKIVSDNLVNKDLITAQNLNINTNKLTNLENKAIYAENDLNIKAKDIENKKGEILAKNIDLSADNIKNNVGLIQAGNNLSIKANKIENIGEVENLDKYESYYVTWDGRILEENQINDWKRSLGDSDSTPSDGNGGDTMRARQKEEFENVVLGLKDDKYGSLLFPKYENLMRGYLGNSGDYPTKTGTALIPTIPLKEKLRSLGKTTHGKIIAGNNINIENKELLNKDSLISAGNTIEIDTDKVENLVSVGDEKIKIKTGEELMSIKFGRTGHFPNKKVRMTAKYTRDFANDYITKKVPKLDKNGNPIYRRVGDTRIPVYKKVTEYIGRYGYVTGNPSVIEGKNVVIDSAKIVAQDIEDANGILRNKDNIENKLDKNFNLKIGISDKINNAEIFVAKIENPKIDIKPNLESALFIKNLNPSSKYLLETRTKYVSLNNYYGSDYFLNKIAYEEKWDRVKRLGDAFYENQLVEKSLTEKLGTRFLNGTEITMKKLIDNASAESSKLNLVIGKELTKEQIENLDKDIVWYEYQDINGIKVLAPKVYLSKNTMLNINSNEKNRIEGKEITSINTNELNNSGIIGNSGTTYIKADNILNASIGDISAEIKGDKTYLISENNILNIGSKISATEELNLIVKNGDILNQSTISETNRNFEDLNRTKHSEIKNIAEISSNGKLNILADNYTNIASRTDAKDLNILVKEDVNISSQKLSGEQKFGKDASNFVAYDIERNIGSNVNAENLNIDAKNLNIKGSAVVAKNAKLDADDVNIDSNVDKTDRELRMKEKKLFSTATKKEIEHSEENIAGTLYVEDKAEILGNINVMGSNLVLGKDSYIAGKLSTDSKETFNKYILDKRKKGFSLDLTKNSFNLGYGKNKFNYDGKDKTNIKSNLVLGDGTTLNKGAEITATNFKHGDIKVNIGDVVYGARKDEKDVKITSKSSNFGISANINSPALERIKQGANAFDQIGNDTLAGLVNIGNAITVTVEGLASNQGSKQKANGGNTRTKDEINNAKANNDFYIGASANIGYSKSKQESKSHTEKAVVTNITGLDENSKITYNDNKNIKYQGTQANSTTFVYNNVENISKEGIELKNKYVSKDKLSGIGIGVTISLSPSLNQGIQGGNSAYGANVVSLSVNASTSVNKSKTEQIIYENGKFSNVNEVHNNTGTMKLSGFNQENGSVIGNIKNLELETLQNTSKTKGDTKGVSLGANLLAGIPSGSISANKTKGDRNFADNQTTFVAGKDSNLKIENVDNTASIIGTTDDGKITIKNYTGKNLENSEKLKTVGGSVGTSGIGINYSNSEKEGITRNTVVGNVEIEKSSGDSINRDLSKANEITKDSSSSTNVYAESQLINAIINPIDFKEKIDLASQELKDLKTVVLNTIENKGKDNRNFIELLNNQRRGTSLNNLLGNDIKNILENSDNIQKDFSALIENFGKDLGIDLELVYGSAGNMPKDSEISVGSAFIDKETKKATIVINADKINSTSEYIGTVFEELSHIIDGIAGRQDLTVANDKTNSEEGLESLGRPINDYFEEKYSEEIKSLNKNDKIKLSSTKDLSNVNLGDKYGDVLPLVALGVYITKLTTSPDFQLDFMSLTDSGSEFITNRSIGTGAAFVLDIIGTAIPDVQATVIRRGGEVFFKTVDGAVYKVVGKSADEILKIIGDTSVGKKTVKLADDVLEKLSSVINKVDSKIDDALGVTVKNADSSVTKVGKNSIIPTNLDELKNLKHNVNATKKHIEGSTYYEQEIKKGVEKSYFNKDITVEEIEKFYKNGLDNAEILESRGGGRRVFVETGKPIGMVKNNGKFESTSKIQFHISLGKGYHAVPYLGERGTKK